MEKKTRQSEPETETGTQVILHSRGESGIDAPEDVHGSELPETTGMRYKNVNLVTRTQKRMGPVGCFGQIENIKRQSLLKSKTEH